MAMNDKDKKIEENIKLKEGERKVLKEVIEREKENVRSDRFKENGKSKYEKVLEKLAEKI